jgi:hypothetical protein
MKYAIPVIAVLLLVYLVIDFNARTAELNRLNADKEAVSTRLIERAQTLLALETQIAYATSDKAVEQYAYMNHQARSGDVPVVVVAPPVSTPTPTPIPVAVVTQTSNLERWVSLFIDSSAP